MRGTPVRRLGRGGDSQNYRQDLNQIKVKLDELNGSRGKAKKNENAAMLNKDLSAIPLNQMKSTQITAAPTMEDYNALQADVADIHTTLSTILGRSSK